MNKPLLFLIFLALIIFAFRYFNNSPSPQPNKIVPTPTIAVSTADAIKNLLAQKYNRSADTVNLQVSEDSGSFSKGSVGFKGEMGGGLWFAAKTAHGWELAYDGQGIMSCELATKYNFPTTMVPGCIDTANKNAFVKR